DQVIILEDQPVTVNPPGVLNNDIDADQDSLLAILDAQPLHGTVQLGLDGKFTYTPQGNYNGTDAFTYHVSDGQASSGQATVSIQIGAVNDSPSFNLGLDESAADDAGERVIPSWVQGVMAGAEDETDQKPTFQ